jgi:hypothetical protein
MRSTSPIHARIHGRPRRVANRTLAGIALVAAVGLSGCATSSPAYHSYVMQGQVLSVENDTVDVCVGTRDGAAIDQVLEVVRHVPRKTGPKAPGPSFRREAVGTVRIVSIYDEHYATAVVVSGQPQISDTVEFERR